MKSVMIVEDDLDLQSLIEAIFSMDSRFLVAGLAESAEHALEIALTTPPQIIVLDHGLAGPLTGIDAAPRFKEILPTVKIVLFTAHAELQARVEEQPAVDAFLLKTESSRLLTLAQRLTGLS
jgi:DNA-binding NarL/FixJ family response regulator